MTNEDFNKAKEYYIKYITSRYKIDNPKIKRKYEHTFRVIDNAEFICKELNLSEEDIILGKLIALLHDIGRFIQIEEINVLRDNTYKYDHAEKGIILLFDNNEIRNYIKDDKYDEIIKKAIAHHSEYEVDFSNMNEIEKLHIKIIIDADKIDGIRNKIDADLNITSNITEEEIINSKISDKIYNDFKKEKTIISSDRKTGLDIWLSYIAIVFGLYFDCSIKLIKDNNYINQLFNRFEYKEDSKKVKELNKIVNEYLNKRT